MTEPTITVQFQCHECDLPWTDVQVRERRGSDENVADWVRFVVGGEVQLEHKRRSPGCRCDVVDLKIPMPKAATFIGQGQRQ